MIDSSSTRRSSGRARRRGVASTALAGALVLAGTGAGAFSALTGAQAASSGAPDLTPLASLRGTFTSGGSQNELHEFLASHAGEIVSVDVLVSRPAIAQLANGGRRMTLTSGCGSSKSPANCSRNLDLAGTRYQFVEEEGLQITSQGGGDYRVVGHLAVSPMTRDAQGYYTVVLRPVVPNGPPTSKS